MTEGKPPMQPDIQYHPDYQKYQARAEHRKATEALTKTLPAGFSAELISPLVWEGKTSKPEMTGSTS